MRAGLNLRDKKCNNCGKIFPENTNICDNCGSISFTFLDLKKESEIETIPSSQELIEQEEIQENNEAVNEEESQKEEKEFEEEKEFFEKKSKKSKK